MNTFIYALIDPRTNHIRYIGKANNPKRRFVSGHLSEIHSGHTTKKINWIKCLISNNLKPILLIIDEVPIDGWQFWEMYYIKLYNDLGFNLLNGSIGGENPPLSHPMKGKHHSLKTIEKIKYRRKFQKNHRKGMSEEEKRNATERLRLLHIKRIGQKDSEETKLKRGRSVSIALKKSYKDGKIAPWNKNIKMSPEQINNTKGIIQLSLKGEYIRKFISAREAFRLYGYSYQHISQCLRGFRNKCSGFKWVFEKDYDAVKIINDYLK